MKMLSGCGLMDYSLMLWAIKPEDRSIRELKFKLEAALDELKAMPALRGDVRLFTEEVTSATAQLGIGLEELKSMSGENIALSPPVLDRSLHYMSTSGHDDEQTREQNLNQLNLAIESVCPEYEEILGQTPRHGDTPKNRDSTRQFVSLIELAQKAERFPLGLSRPLLPPIVTPLHDRLQLHELNDRILQVDGNLRKVHKPNPKPNLKT